MEVKKYDIELDVDFSGLKYTGHERIEAVGNGEKFFLNSVGLNITDISSGGKNVPFRINKAEEKVETDLVLNGPATVEVKFDAPVGETLQGLYVARYEGGYILTTQFESTGARRAFPCIDHPSFKSVFSLRLKIAKNLEAISNMPVKGEKTISEEKKLVDFGDSPRMSTYLLYIGIGEFDHMKRRMGKIEGILSAPKGELKTTDFPLVEAENIIKYFEEYFDIDFILPKLHLISVPEFGAGAMENWGAITFREVVLLVNENTSNIIRQTISEVIAHEIAHQWFGDLVTMEWWNDLWLNESFATFMAFKATHQLHPEWKMFGKMLLSDTAGALTGDALKNSHPIEVEVKSPDDIAQIFDEISYGKGASILRMIEGYVGEDNFRDGIRKYLKDHMYGNAKGSDLWSSIEEVSGMPVSMVMEAWVKEEGYPVLNVSRSGDKIKIDQSRFMFQNRGDPTIWPVPLTVLREDGTESVLMEGKEIELDAHGFVKLNVNETGFYRVKYEHDLKSKIKEQNGKISFLDRWGLVSDNFAFLRAGLESLDEYLEAVEPFLHDDEYVVAQELSSQFLTLSLILPGHMDLKRIAVNFYRDHRERLGDKKPGEDENSAILRGAVSLNLAILDAEYAKSAAGKISEFFSYDPDVRQSIAVGYAVNKNDMAGLVKLLESSQTDEDRIRVLNALGSLAGQENFTNVMDLTNSDRVKKQDTMRVYMSLSMNPDQRGRMFGKLEEVVSIMEKYFEGTGYTGMLLEMSVPYLGLGRVDEMKKKLASIRKDSYSKGIDKGLELLSIYSGLVQRSS